jgi:hypothetical protein
MVGALKTNVAQLESEKDGLARELAEQKAENRRIENELAVVSDQNGDLSARLDDARAVMSRQGFEDGATSRSASDSDRPAKRRATPAAAPKSRKAPFAQIPAERRPVDDSDEGTLDTPSSREDRYDLGPQSRLDDRSPWMPVARGRNSPTRSMK